MTAGGSAGRSRVEVRLEDLTRKYATTTALDRLTLTLAPGELVALLGPSHCGKTTALRLLAALEEADSGRVVIDGHDVTNVPANRRNIGMVVQAYSLFPHLTDGKNADVGLTTHHVGPALLSWPTSWVSPTASKALSGTVRWTCAGNRFPSFIPTSRTAPRQH